jgi:hypothetical protein
MASQTSFANFPPSPPSKVAVRREKKREEKRNLTTYRLIDKWRGLCKWEDNVSTEVMLEGVDITEKEKSQIMFNMGQRVLKHITEYEDVGQQDHSIPVPRWYSKRRGSAYSSVSAGSDASRGSDASVEVGRGGWKAEGGFKPWAKEEGVVEEKSDVWRFGKGAREEDSSAGVDARVKEKRQPSTGTCATQ